MTYDATIYTVTVEVTDNGDGTLMVTASDNATKLVFTNEYIATGDVQFSGSKALTGKGIEAGMFSFELLDADGNVIKTVQNAADGSFSFTEIAYTLEDVDQIHTYTVREIPGNLPGVTYDATVYTITVEVTDNGDGTLTANASDNATKLVFTNEYAATGDVQFSGSKALTGKDIEASMFSFELLDADGNVIETVQNAADGSFSFTEIAYTLDDAGKTHTYTVREIPGSLPGVTYDATVYTITVEVTDNGDGTLTATASDNANALTFTNAFEAENSLTLTAAKTINGAEPGEAVFRFVLADGNGTTLQTVTNDGSLITFAPLTFDQDDAGKTFVYTVSEMADERPYYTVDERVYTVTVAVSLDDAGGLKIDSRMTCDGAACTGIAFDNVYEAAGTLQLTAQKTVNGGIPAEGQVYEFVLEGEGIALKAQNEGESVIFDEIVYDLTDAGRTHTYTVRETTASSGSMTADNSVYTVTVTVIDNGDGTLTASPVITLDGAEVGQILFDNAIEAPLTVSKQVVGCETAQMFLFIVNFYDVDGSELATPVSYTGVVEGELYSGDLIMLAHGQSITFTGLTPGMRYSVEEIDDIAFTTVVNGLPMNIVEGECVENGNRADFVNTLKTTDFSVRKVWDGGMGGSIVLTLYADGEKMEPQPLYTQDGDTYTYTGLPMYNADGDLVVYSAREKYMDGYLTIYDNPAPYQDDSGMVYDGGTIINRAVTSIRVQKVWKGLGADEEPLTIQLTLYCNGEPLDRRQPKPDADGWYVYNNLPLTRNGQMAEYWVVEEPLPGFEATYADPNGNAADRAFDGYTITNTRSQIPATGDDAPLALWAALLAGSVAAMVLLMRRRKGA